MQEARREINLSRIRKSYNVPAYVGVRILDKDFEPGVIIGATSSEHLKIQLDIGGCPRYDNPIQEITYLVEGFPNLEIRTKPKREAVIKCPNLS